MTLSDSYDPSTAPEKTLDATEENVFAFPLSFAQQRLWFLDQLEPNSPLYNIPKAVRMRGFLNVEALQQTLDALVARHEVLRTTFTSVDGSPVQIIAERQSVALPVIDLRALPESEREAAVQCRLNEEAGRPFDLSRDVMLRAIALRLAPEEHILLLTMHHIASDGWSMGILMRELAALYEAFSRGEPSPLPALPIQYADYAVWQRQWLQGEVLEAQLAYWKHHLAGTLPVLQLPTDRPRPAVQTYQGTEHSLVLPKALSDALKVLSQREGVTLFMVLLAAFQTLLHRYTGQDDILVGSPIAGRNQVETEGLIGFFVNTLVLRTDLSGNPTFRALLHRVRELALGAYAHQDVPFERLVEVLQPERDRSHSPLFQVMFILQNAPQQALELPGLTLTPLKVDSGTAKFDLTLSMAESTDGLRGVWEYNTELFEAATISQLAGHFQTLLEGIVAHPERRLAELPLLTEAERQLLLVEWNATQADYPQDRCIQQLFEAQVARTPDAIAAVFEDQQLTYGELNARANQLAHYLRQLGVGPEVLVGIYMERSVELVVGLLGILKAGGAYVPLDPAYPKERLAFMLEDTQAPVLVTQQRLVASLPPHQANVVCLDTNWVSIAQEREQNPISPARVEHLAYVIYTSGSTGRPKGVMGLHQGTINRLHWMWERYPFAPGEVCCQKTSLSFVDSVWEIFGPLLQGIPTVMIPDDVLKDPQRLVQTLAMHRITRLVLVPSLLQVLLDAVTDLDNRLPHLQYWITSGEALSLELAHRFSQQMPQRILLNLYGSSEVSADSTWYDIRQGEAHWSVPIGWPIANTQVYVLDPHLHLMPIGVPGELYIGGLGLARGYLNRPELTTERFICHPFSGEPGEQLYKTGDVARYRTDGMLEFLGRMDHQVKVRGFRIELGEIEAVLRQHPALRETVVLAREDSPGEKRLVAYVVPVPAQAPTTTELRSFLKAKLPDYMVPAVFVWLDSLPLTPSGKVDRRALPIPDQAQPELPGTSIVPRDVLEFQLTTIWEEALGIQSISVTDNFFDLGGHSLLAVRLFAQIEKTFGQKLPLATLFQAPTVEQLANVLRQEGWSPPWSSLVAIQPGGSKPPFFCVHAHGGHVFVFKDLAKHLGPDQPFYGLQALGLNDDQARPRGIRDMMAHHRIEEMAVHYLKEIQTLQPEGPYFLGGYCFGGKVAFEMAQKLYAQGQKVGLLVLLDAYAPGYPKKLPWVRRAVIQRINFHVGNLRRLGPQERLNYILEKGGIVRTKVETKLKKIACKVYLGFGRSLTRAPREVQEASRRAFSRYAPSVYPGRITLFRPSQQPKSCYPDPHMGWSGLAAGGLEIYEVPGPFAGIIIEPNVRVMAERLRVCLEEALTTPSSQVQQ